MAARQQTTSERRGLAKLGVPILRQFVVRLEQPGLYDKLFQASLRRSGREGKHVPMTDIAREAIERHLEEDDA